MDTDKDPSKKIWILIDWDTHTDWQQALPKAFQVFKGIRSDEVTRDNKKGCNKVEIYYIRCSKRATTGPWLARES